MRLLSVLALLVAGFTMACGTEDPHLADERVGQIFLPVSTTGSDGNVYLLTEGMFDISGPVAREISAAGEGNLLTDLPFGEYQVALRPGWELARREVDGSLTHVEAVLASRNPSTVHVQPGAIVTAPFEFLLGGDGGTLHIGMGVSDEVGVITGRIDRVTDMAYSSEAVTPNGFAGVDGQDLDFIIRFSQLGTFTGTMENGNKTRSYLTNGIYLRFPTTGSGVLVGEVLPQLTGSIGNFTVESISEFEGIGSFGVTDVDAAGNTTYRFSLYSFPVSATRDEQGFPVLSRDFSQDVRTDDAELQRFGYDADGVFRVTGEITGSSSVYFEMP